MFDSFKNSQDIAYSLLCNAVKNNKLSHAYLIDGNNNDDAFDFVISFVKMIVCSNNYSNYDNCGSCNICKRIDEGNYTEVKIIDTDGLIIKKEQLLDLQSDFSRTGLEGNKRIYIIKDCDKMNKHAANSLLKFLEEPDDNIIAILFTNNINNVLSTIISRCQLIKLVKNKNKLLDDTMINFANDCCDNRKDVDLFIKDENNVKLLNNILNFIDYFEDNGLDTILYTKKLWYNVFLSRNDSIIAIKLLTYFYYDVLKYKLNINNYFFSSDGNIIKKVAKNNEIDTILKKIDICSRKCDDLKFNLNVNLLIDDMIIRLGE